MGYSTGSDKAQTVTLPHTWNSDALAGIPNYARGAGNYIKRVDIPTEWREKRVFITFYVASTVANLFINGKFVGEHRGGNTAFCFEITNHVNYGQENDIRVIINNSERVDVFPLSCESNIYGGLTRGAELILTDNIAVSPAEYGADGVFIIPQNISSTKADGNVYVTLLAPNADKTAQVEAIFSDEKGVEVSRREQRVKMSVKNGKSMVNIPFEIENPKLWNGIRSQPKLYNVTVKVSVAGVLHDSLTVRTGLRKAEVRDDGAFYLNDVAYEVRGVVLYGDRAVVGTAMSEEHQQQDLDILTNMGATAVRTAEGSRAKYFYEECDRRGLLVWCDLPLCGSPFMADRAYVDSKELRENGKQQLREMIAQNINSPSIVMWGIFSNIKRQGDDVSEFVKELEELARTTDRSRLTVASSNSDGAINFTPQLIVWNQSFGWSEGEPDDINVWQEQLHRNWSSLRSAVSYAAGGQPAHQDAELARPDIKKNRHSERWQTYFHERYMHNVGSDPKFWGVWVGNMFDFGSARRMEFNGMAFNDFGLVTIDRSTPKDAYYLYKAVWNSEPMLHLTEKRWRNREGQKQSFKCYTNTGGVELFVNGESRGEATPAEGIARWEGVMMRKGENTIEVTSKDTSLSDRMTLVIF